MRNSYLILLTTLILFACEPSNGGWEVVHRGVLREIMQEQKIEANADLKDYENTPNLYALGALEGLAGEILIIDGQPFNGIANQGTLLFDKGFEKKATLLVSSQVEKWGKIDLKESFNSLQELQVIILAEGKRAGINTTEAFPFMLKGDFQTIDWHVINAGEAEAQNHEAYKKAGLSGSGGYLEAQILGFYSEQHEGIFTHHGSYVHLHFLSGDKATMGHVDALEQQGAFELYLPKMKN